MHLPPQPFSLGRLWRAIIPSKPQCGHVQVTNCIFALLPLFSPTSSSSSSSPSLLSFLLLLSLSSLLLLLPPLPPPLFSPSSFSSSPFPLLLSLLPLSSLVLPPLPLSLPVSFFYLHRLFRSSIPMLFNSFQMNSLVSPKMTVQETLQNKSELNSPA